MRTYYVATDFDQKRILNSIAFAPLSRNVVQAYTIVSQICNTFISFEAEMMIPGSPSLLSGLCDNNFSIQGIFIRLTESLLTLNTGIEFTPVISTWLTLLAVFNLLFPQVFFQITWIRCRKVASVTLKCMLLWYFLHLIWIPGTCTDLQAILNTCI